MAGLLRQRLPCSMYTPMENNNIFLRQFWLSIPLRVKTRGVTRGFGFRNTGISLYFQSIGHSIVDWKGMTYYFIYFHLELPIAVRGIAVMKMKLYN
jgi:hypothetical protein